MTRRLGIAIIIILAATAGLVFFINWHYSFFISSQPLPSRQFTEDLLKGKEIAVKPPASAKIILVGDIMLSRNVASAVNRANDPLLPFRGVGDLLKSADFAFGNLESPFSGSDKFNASPSMIFNAPVKNLAGLVEYGFKILSLANNHALDQGRAGLDSTVRVLEENGIKTVGAGTDPNQPWLAQVIEAGGLKIGFLAASYASYNDGGKNRNDYVARTEDLDILKSKISSLKSETDFVIVAMHAGTEYVLEPNRQQIGFAHAAIDAGADVVVGSHPHWIQPVERYGNGLIFYSLGNFIFDQEWSQKTKEGLAVRLTIKDGQMTEAELIPVIIENYCCVRVADTRESARILQNINASSTIKIAPGDR